MAFPTLAATNTTVTSGAATNFNFNLPSNISSGDLLILYARISNASNLTLPANWAFLVNNVISVDDDKSAIIYKTADGTEGSTINISYSVDPLNSAGMCAVTHRITGWTGTPEVSTTAQGLGADANANSLTPTTGLRDYLWIQAVLTDGSCTGETNPDTTDGDFFSGMVRASNNINASDKVTVMTWSLQKRDNSLDPAENTLDTGRRWDAWTLSVQGTEPVEFSPTYKPRIGWPGAVPG